MRPLLLVALLALPAWSQSADWESGIAQVSAKGMSPGTGVVVAVRGGRAYVVTCSHVVGGDPKPTVTFRAAPEQPYPAAVRHLQGERKDGLALLVVEKPPVGVKAVQAQADAGAVAGTPAVVAGYPVSVGAFTVLTATIASIRGTELFITPQTDEGFSGGPVLVDGRVAGIVYGREGGFGLAVPAAIVDVYLRGLEVRWGSEGPKPAEAKVEPAGPSVPTADTIRVNPKDGLKYVWIPPGKFMMGCSLWDKGCEDDEKPPHEVTITRGFFLGRTEVTEAAYTRFASATGGARDSASSNPSLPVVNVSWEDAKAYCEWAGMRLPTEAEWEYAARATNMGARYGALDDVAWYGDNSGKKRLDTAKLWASDRANYDKVLKDNGNRVYAVAGKEPNAWGLYDMLGNVWEWVADWYGDKYYEQKVGLDPVGPQSGQQRVLRGGSWNVSPDYVRVSYRGWYVPTFRLDRIGFRCAGELR